MDAPRLSRRRPSEWDAQARATRVSSPARHDIAFALALAASMALLGGCTEASRGTIDAMRLAWKSSTQLKPTAEQVAAKPYYQLRATLAQGDAVLILGNVMGTREYWYGKDGVVLVLQHGRVVQTIGLPQNLDGSRVAGNADPFAQGLQARDDASYERMDDWSPGYRYNVPVHAELKRGNETSIDILGVSRPVVQFTEKVSSRKAGYHASNRYWVDPTDGFVWMSEQEFMPGVTVKLVELRPYRKAIP